MCLMAFLVNKKQFSSFLPLLALLFVFISNNAYALFVSSPKAPLPIIVKNLFPFATNISDKQDDP